MPSAPACPTSPVSYRRYPFLPLASLLLILIAASAPAQTAYTVSHLAGPLGGPGNADGIGSNARFWNPEGVAVDLAGNIYVADTSSETLRKITAGGLVTTFAGIPDFPNGKGTSYPSSGPAPQTPFSFPGSVTVDSAGNLYVANQGDNTISKVSPTGVATILAGASGVSGAIDGSAFTARFNQPTGVAVDTSGNVYVADQSNHTIRQISAGGIVTTVAGSAGVSGSTDGSDTSALFNNPTGVAVDLAGNVYVADSNNHTIRKIAPAPGGVTTLAGLAGASGSVDGTGTAARFNQPAGVAVDNSGNVYVADQYNHTIRKITAAGVVTTLAGTPGVTGFADGTGTTAQFTYPSGVAVDSAGNVVVADTTNCLVRRVTPGGVVTTVAGNAAQFGGADGTGTAARFGLPSAAAFDATGNLYVADTTVNSSGLVNLLRKVTPGGSVTTLATMSVNANTRVWSPNYFPTNIGVDAAGNVYVAEKTLNMILKVTPSGVVSTLAGTAGMSGSADGTGAAARFNQPLSIGLDATGNLFVTDTNNNTIRKITPAGVVTTLAGTAGVFGTADGTGTAATFISPTGIAVDSAGNLFVSDNGASGIRKVTPAGVVTTLATGLGVYTHMDGSGITDSYTLAGVAVDASGNVYVAAGSTIQKVTPAGLVTTIAGTPGLTGSLDGVGSVAQFNVPNGLAVDSAGTLYITDINNSAIRKAVVAGPPAITAQPTGQSVGAGGNVQFSVTASSALTLTYQWMLNGSPLSGATGSSLNLNGVMSANAGDYTVVVTNAAGNVTSSKATLTVGAAMPPPSSGGGGGGAMEAWFAFAVLALAVGSRFRAKSIPAMSLLTYCQQVKVAMSTRMGPGNAV